MEILTYFNIHHTLVCAGEGKGGVLCDTRNQTDVVRLGWVSSGWVGVGQFVQLGRTLTYSIFWMKVSKLSPGIT